MPVIATRGFFFNDTATTEIYTLSLHDALPICIPRAVTAAADARLHGDRWRRRRSEEHTSELQSRPHLACRLLLEKKPSASVELVQPVDSTWLMPRSPSAIEISLYTMPQIPTSI